MAFRLAVYASQGGLPHHHARLASGRWSGATGRAFHPKDSDERFQICKLHLILLSQALLGAMASTGASYWSQVTPVWRAEAGKEGLRNGTTHPSPWGARGPRVTTFREISRWSARTGVRRVLLRFPYWWVAPTKKSRCGLSIGRSRSVSAAFRHHPKSVCALMTRPPWSSG